MSFNWTELVVGHEYEHVATLGISGVAMIGAGLYARQQMTKQKEAAAPASKFSLQGLFELNVEFIGNLARSIIGHDADPYIPYFSAIFGIILINNLIGLIPGMSPATENINTTFAFGVVSFIGYNIVGFRAHGIAYLKQLIPLHIKGVFDPMILLGILLLMIELMSHVIRPLTLGLRLANVLTGDHKVVEVFLGLVKYPMLYPIPFYALGLMVCFIQAFVFTLLSMVYIALAKSHH